MYDPRAIQYQTRERTHDEREGVKADPAGLEAGSGCGLFRGITVKMKVAAQALDLDQFYENDLAFHRKI